ncbi:glutathione S-transferase T3-like [Helianthus annuus]|uniref:glutathione S-transferase T3-like n=1 Tax=Helianthus annuus TaxID=4232 RepID=UPI0016531A61|nr:glutathione S-transferase T3-like [Helianthus annuus]
MREIGEWYFGEGNRCIVTNLIDEKDSGEDEEEYEDEDDDIGEASEPKQKGVKAERQTWTKKHEEALAKAWVHCSLNKKQGNQQKRDSFWKKVLDHYNETVGGSTRTVHQVRSKWMPMLTKINNFNGLWHQADRIRGSGCSDVDVMNRALSDFKPKYPSGFQHIEAWEVVRKHDKWAPVPLLGEDSGS